MREPNTSTDAAIDTERNGNHVVIRWDGAALLNDGQTCRNSYAWFFEMLDGEVVKATAFLARPTYDAAIAGGQLPPWPSA